MNLKTFFEKVKKLFVREKPKKKIALALGSGGAKGMAHLGALRAFEEEGITFDIVCGSSIGSIVGGLYANGYSVTDMEQILGTINFSDYILSFRPNMDMQPIERLLENYIDKNIEELPIPYRAVATNAVTMKQKAFESGSCARAMCASSSMPPFFASVKIGDEEYFDGAFSDAIPADVCRELGADVVFGVDLSTESVAPQSGIRGLISALITPDVQPNDDAKTIGYENSDLVIKPDLTGFSALSISEEKRGEMYNRGYEAVKAHMDEIREIIKKVNSAK